MDGNKSCITINCGCCGTSNGNGGGSGAENVYSIEETVCGTWINGKLIYRKVISGVLEKESKDIHDFADVSELNIDRIIDIYGNLIDKENNTHATIQASYNGISGVVAAVNMNYHSSTKKLAYSFLNCGGLYSGCAVYVIIEYTKK